MIVHESCSVALPALGTTANTPRDGTAVITLDYTLLECMNYFIASPFDKLHCFLHKFGCGCTTGLRSGTISARDRKGH